MPRPTVPARRLRLRALVVAGVCVALGLLAQLGRTPLLDVAGSVLYVVLVGMLVVIALPGLPGPAVAAVAFGVAAGVELLQLTELPALVVGVIPAAGLVLGHAFDPVDLVAYAGAAVLLLLLHPALVGSGSPAPPAASQPGALP